MSKLPGEPFVEGAEEKSPLPSRKEVQAALGVAPQVRTTAERPEGVPRRRRYFGSSKLGVDCSALQEAGFHCHWINDVTGRIQEAQDCGYEFVSLSEIKAGPTLGAPSADEKDRVSRRVGVAEDGSELRAYLMKIRQDWYEENQAYYQERCDAVDRAIAAGTVEHVDHAYHPKDGIRYVPRSR